MRWENKFFLKRATILSPADPNNHDCSTVQMELWERIKELKLERTQIKNLIYIYTYINVPYYNNENDFKYCAMEFTQSLGLLLRRPKVSGDDIDNLPAIFGLQNSNCKATKVLNHATRNPS